MRKTGLLFSLIIPLIAAPLFPASLEELAGVQRSSVLRGALLSASKGSSAGISEVQLKNPRPLLLPEHEGIKRLAGEVQQGLQPSIMVEVLYLYRKPQTEALSESERTRLFNQLLALSTLAGTQYFSASRNEMRTFYETSRVIDGPDSKKTLPDPAYAAVPPSLTLYARQKDLTFGENIYRYEYRSFPDAFVFVQENLTALSAGIIPAVGKNKLRSLMAVYDCGDSLLIYASSMAKATPLPGLGERIGNSFLNRAEAILKWFADRAGAVFDR